MLNWNQWSLFDWETETNERAPSILRTPRLRRETRFADTFYLAQVCPFHRAYPDSADFCRGEVSWYCRSPIDVFRTWVATMSELQWRAEAQFMLPFGEELRRFRLRHDLELYSPRRVLVARGSYDSLVAVARLGGTRVHLCDPCDPAYVQDGEGFVPGPDNVLTS